LNIEGLRRLHQTASGFLQTRLTPNITESAEFLVTVNVGIDGELVVPSVSLLKSQLIVVEQEPIHSNFHTEWMSVLFMPV